MKHMKSIVSAALALAMTLGMAIPAMAAESAAIQQNTPVGKQDTYIIQGIIGKETCQVGADIVESLSDGSEDILLSATPSDTLEVYVVEPGKVADITGTNGCYVEAAKLVDGKLYPNNEYDWTANDPWENLTSQAVQHPMDSSMEITEYSGYVTLDKEGYYVISAWTYDGVYHVSEMARVIHVTDDSTSVNPDEPSDPSTSFTDVPAGAYYTDAVTWAVKQGVTGGTTSTTFSPNDPCTRAQVITFLYRAAGSPDVSAYENPFTDVTETDYYYAAAIWAAAKGIAGGTSATTFAPGASCTRAQVVTFLYRAAGSPAASLTNTFADVAATDYYAAAVAWATANEITGGTSATTFSPSNACTRAQVVTFLYRSNAD